MDCWECDKIKRCKHHKEAVKFYDMPYSRLCQKRKDGIDSYCDKKPECLE